MTTELDTKWYNLCVEANLTEEEINLFNQLINCATSTFVKRYGNKFNNAYMNFAACQQYLADELTHHAGKNIAECDLLIKLHETKMFDKFIKFFINVFIDAVK